MGNEELVKKQRTFFASGKTLSLSFRIKALDRLEQTIIRYEQELYKALRKDLGKSKTEYYTNN